MTTIVLAEGPSDVAALRVIAEAHGLTEARAAFRLVDMAGVTNVGRHLEAAEAVEPPVRVLGLCDAAETDVVVRALRRRAVEVAGADDLGRVGFFVCTRDLEDELIRALGVGECLVLLDRLDLAGRFQTFCQQPAWVGRPVGDQLRRFAGVASGRKVMLAGAMAAVLPVDRTPAPIAALLEALRAGTS